MTLNKRKPAYTVWAKREDMVERGMAISLPWFAFVNISFALMILFRRALFTDADTLYQAEKSLLLSIDSAVIGIVLISVVLIFSPRRKSWLYQGCWRC